MPTIQFYGEEFQVESEVSQFALMEFAEAAADGQDGDTMQGMASMLRLIQSAVAPDEWVRFRASARKNRADAASLTEVIKGAFGSTERPTGRSSDSSDGPLVTAPRSELSSEDRALEASGLRPDQKLAVLRSRDVA